jgi:hypothetical protein
MEVGRSARPTDDDVGFAWSGRRRARAASHGVIDNDRKFRSTDGSDLGEDVVALGRKPFCRLGYIAFGEGQSYAIN